uniref:DUF4592 domain-containing protein n=1 Tax=Rousettus aegyptiacus TaxID=9407 RepID=A0A7J8EJZ9_ROUAE|nr:hypothetical protein HJG63_007215 [Rousettus aegyptiacus]
MAESRNEASGSLEVLEASDEGKKKSKFKAFKNCFGKKKKKEPEDVQGGRRLKSRVYSGIINISSLKPVQEGQQPKPRIKRSMGNKCLSHDSIFMLEPERSTSKTCHSPEPQRGGSLQRSHDFRSLPRTGSVHEGFSGAVFGVVSQYVPRSRTWIADSKITEIPPLHLCQPGISPLYIKSDTISKDFEEIYVDDDRSPKTPQKKLLPENILMLKKVKPKQEEPNLTQVSEEKSTNKPKEADEKNTQKDNAGPLSQEQNNEIEIYDKTTDQSANTDAAGSQGYLWSAACGRQHGRKGSSASENSECEPRERSSKQSCQVLDLGNTADSTPADNTARDCLFWHLSLEEQVMEEPIPPQAETATSQKLLSDKNEMERRKASLDFEVREASTSHLIPEDTEESIVSGLSPYHEGGDSGAEKTEAIACLLPVVESPFTTQEDIMFSVAVRAQLLMDPSHIELEEEDAPSFDSQESVQFKMESSRDIPSICKESPPGNVLQTFTASISDIASVFAERSISAERLSLRSLSQSLVETKAEEVFSDSKHASEEGSGSEQQLAPRHSFQSLGKLKDDQEELSSSHEQLAPRSPSQSLGELEDEVFTELNSYVEKYNSADDWRSSEEELSFRYPSQALEKPEDQQEVSSVSKNTPGLWSVSVEQIPPRHLSQPFVRPFVQQQVSSGSMNASAEWELMLPRHTFQPWESPKSKQQDSAGLESAALEWGISMKPLPPRMTPKRLMRHKVKQPVSSGLEITAAEGITSMELQPPRHHSQLLMKPTVEQEISAGPESPAAKGNIFVEPPPMRHPFQPCLSPKLTLKASSFPENTADQERNYVVPQLSKVFAQPLMNAKVEQNVFSGSESAETVISVEALLPQHFPQSLTNAQAQHSFSENTAGNEGIFVQPLPQKHFCQPLESLKFQPKTITSKSASASTGWGGPVDPVPPRHTFQPWESLRFEQYTSSDPESTAVEWGIPKEPLPPRMPSQPLMRSVVKQEVFPGSMSAPAEWCGPMNPMPPRHAFQPRMSPKSRQQASASSGRAVAERSNSMGWMPPRNVFQPLVNPKFEKQASSSSERAVAERSSPMERMPPGNAFQAWVSHKSERQASASSNRAVVERSSPMEWMPPRRVFQPLVSPKSEWQASVSSERAVAEKDSPMEWMPPRNAFQPWVSHNTEQQASASSKRAVVERSSPMGWMPPRNAYQPWVSHKSEQQASASSKRAGTEKDNSMEWMPPRRVFQPLVSPKSEWQASVSSERAVAEKSSHMEWMPPRMSSQSPVRLVVKQDVFSGSMSAPAEWSSPMEPMPPRKPSQPRMKPVVKQSISEGPKNVAFEGDTSAELLPSRNWSIVRHKFQQTSSFESAAVEGGIFERSSKYPSHFLMRSKVHEIISRLENTAVEGGTSKKLLLPKRPSQSFVKFMAQQIFSETPAIEERIYVDPVSSKQPSKSLLRPKVEYQIFSDWKRADIEGGISLKLLPTKCPSQSLGRPEDPREVFSHSESAPAKWISSQEQLPPRYLSQKLGKLENQQNVLSVSKSSPKEWWFQAEGGAEFQPYSFSTDSVSVPVEQISAKDDHLPPRYPFQALSDPKYQQQVYSCSMNAPAKGNIFESNPSSWSLLRGPASQNKTRKHGQDFEDVIKNIPTPATKPVKFMISPAWPTSTSGDIKEEVLENSDHNNSYSDLLPSGADVENHFGVRLRRIPSSKKQESEKQDHFTKLSSLSLSPVSSYVGGEPQIRSASQGPLGIRENVVTTISDFAAKQQNRTRSGSMAKKQPTYKIPGEAPIEQSDYATSEPAWITMVKQRQRNFPTHIPMKELKTNNRAEAKAEIKKPRYEGAENRHRKIFTSNVNRQEKMAQMDLLKSTKAVGFEDQKIFQVPSTRKEIRESSTFPPVLQEPFEPVWFSLARKIAKAWSHIADIM